MFIELTDVYIIDIWDQKITGFSISRLWYFGTELLLSPFELRSLSILAKIYLLYGVIQNIIATAKLSYIFQKLFKVWIYKSRKQNNGN